jgi:ABC-type glycerol-3-phosphate transport system substrate-binding protein
MAIAGAPGFCGTRRGVLGGAAATGALLAACDGAPPAQTLTRSAAPVTLVFMHYQPIKKEQFAPAWPALLEKTNITIEVDNTNDSNQTKLFTMLAADTGPDLWEANSRVITKMYDNGSVLALDARVARDRIPFDRDWAPTGVEHYRQKIYGVPYWNEPFAVYYNKSLFRQKGVEDPWTRSRNQGDWTLEEMLDAARKLNDPPNDVYGMQWELETVYGIGTLIWGQGVSHLQFDPKIEINLSLPEYTEAITWALDWSVRQKLNVGAPTPEMTDARNRIQGGRPGLNVTGGVNLFSQGRIGIHWRSVNDWQRLWSVVGTSFEWDMLPVPQIKGKPGASRSAGHPACAWAKGKQLDAAWTALKYLMGDDFQGFLAEGQAYVPAKKSFQARYFRPPADQPHQHPQVFANMYKRPFGTTWSHYNATKNEADYTAEITRVFRGEMPVSALKDVERRLNLDVDTGPGDNPFKGVRWPFQPK